MPHSAVLTSPDERAIARLLRADPAEVRDFSLGLAEQRPAHLALFCYAKTHYRCVGLSLAKSCSRHALAAAGGGAGEFLADQALRVLTDDAETPRRRASITLARVGSIAALATSAAA